MTARKARSSRNKFHDVLPDEANRFLRELAVTRKRGTVSGYRGTLYAFYAWMKKRQISLHKIERKHITDWFSELAKSQKSASCRAAKTIHLRIYFHWLTEEGLLHERFSLLVRTKDIPRLPQYLPRPLPPAVDRALTARFKNSENLHHMGLLLMRKTGIRIGELLALPQNCIVTNSENRRFLKVPLGKLNNERLVPLDDAAALLVQRLQQKNLRQNKQFLLERRDHRPPSYDGLSGALRRSASDLDLDAKITTHRLRHTFATELLNAGMSILALMKILGHRSYRMTLRYAAVTQQTVADDYFKAFNRIQEKYAPPVPTFQLSAPDSISLLQDLIRLLAADAQKYPSQADTLSRFIKRTRRLLSDISNWQATL